MYELNWGKTGVMKKIGLIFLVLTIFSSAWASEELDRKNERFKAAADSILGVYTEQEFNIAVLKTLQRSNSTNIKMFIEELESVRESRKTDVENDYGLKNIGREYKTGMNGWSVAYSGILVVFVGLILIALVVVAFNFILKEKKHVKKKKTETAAAGVQQTAVSPSSASAAVPEDHLIAIATAVELYFRLYLHGRPSGNAASSKVSATWKNGNKFGMRTNQR